ncbi:MAG: sulfurtransferase TusA family protein, partial [SAR324 cluster bacterium]|nr:sulfurtransferase TusA family protein [SAR324 cluster bacterium]
MSEFDAELNCEGLNCPLPILKTKKTIDGMNS